MVASSIALVVAGQIRMLSEPMLLENWSEAVLKPLKPVVFMSLNSDWKTGNPSGKFGGGVSSDDVVVERIQSVFEPVYCGVTKGDVHVGKGPHARGAYDWFRAWADAYGGLREFERQRRKSFEVVIQARPDLYFSMGFTPDFFENLRGASYGLVVWDVFAAMSRDVADTRLAMLESKDFLAPHHPDYCRGPWDQCNLMWLKARQPLAASVADFPKNTVDLRIQRNCSAYEPGTPRDFWINTYNGICLDREHNLTYPLKQSRNLQKNEWLHHLRCTSTFSCKNEKNTDILARCAKAADNIKSKCNCQHRLYWNLENKGGENNDKQWVRQQHDNNRSADLSACTLRCCNHEYDIIEKDDSAPLLSASSEDKEDALIIGPHIIGALKEEVPPPRVVATTPAPMRSPQQQQPEEGWYDSFLGVFQWLRRR